MHDEPTSGTNLSGRLGPRVPQRGVAQVAAGEPIPIALRAVEPPNSNQSALWTALVSRHTPPVVAKRVIDFIARGGYAHVLVPVVEDERALNADIAAHGVRVKQVSRTSLYKKPNQASRPLGCSTAKTRAIPGNDLVSRSLNAYEQIELGDSVIIPGDDPMTALVANTTLKELRDRLSEFDDVLAEAAAKRKR